MPVPQFNQAAFSLSSEIPFSDPVRGEDGYYVLEYMASKPSEIPSFEEAKQQVIDRLKQQRAYEAVVKQGRDTARQGQTSRRQRQKFRCRLCRPSSQNKNLRAIYSQR